MTLETILRLLKNSGLNVLGADSAYIYIEDPSCILRGFETFFHYAWIVIVAITGFLLFGWAVSLIRGAKTDIMINIRNLVIMFGALSLTRPIINAIWGGDLFAYGCKNIAIPISEVQRTMDARNSKLSKSGNSLYEDFQIYDSGVIYTDGLNVSAVEIADQSTTETIVETVVSTERGASVASAGDDVIYTNADGSKTRRTSGTRAWRNNNPGNIRYGKFAQQHGAIGQAGGFAVFPDEATGMAAIRALLRTNSYRDLTIAGAINRYSPPNENDTKTYQNRVAQNTRLDMNRRMRDLSDEEIARVANAIRQQEGWRPGKTVRI